jgi:hypothetical protein
MTFTALPGRAGATGSAQVVQDMAKVQALLEGLVKRQLRVTPVILPGYEDISHIPVFLRNLTMIDMRQ